jgi:Dihydrouridine synthase (Dus)
MQKQRKMRGILRGMTSILSAPVTVKMRIGWDEKKPNAHILLPTVIQQFAGTFHSYTVFFRYFLKDMQYFTSFFGTWDEKKAKCTHVIAYSYTAICRYFSLDMQQILSTF